MVYEGPKEGYCYVEISRDVHGGENILGKVQGLAERVLGTVTVAALTELKLVEAEDGEKVSSEGYELTEILSPVKRIGRSEIPPANELRLQLLHRGWAEERATLYPDTAYLKSMLKKSGLHEEFSSIAAAHGQELEGASAWFDNAAYLPHVGQGSILGLTLKPKHPTTEVLTEQAAYAARILRAKNPLVFSAEQPWNLAMALGRFGISEDSYEAKLLLEELNTRIPEGGIRLSIGRIRYSSDELG